MTYREISADILTVDADVIVQQCNCVTTKAHGLSRDIASTYPHGDLYGKREKKSSNTATDDTKGKPGTCVLLEPTSSDEGPAVACLMAQICPGRVGTWCGVYGVDRESDSADARERYFDEALIQLRGLCEKRGMKRIAFPFQIGCGLAGGKWTHYESKIHRFAERVKEMKTQVLVCKKSRGS